MNITRKKSAILTRVLTKTEEDIRRRIRDRMLIAARIDDVLRAKGITQKQFASMLGKAESEVSEWLSGDRNFTADTLSDIGGCLGICLFNIPSIRMTELPSSMNRVKVSKNRKPVIYDLSRSISFNLKSGNRQFRSYCYGYQL